MAGKVVRGQGAYGESVSSSQFCCKFKHALKRNKVLLGKMVHACNPST
jgi:hypothetical protein